jgi:FAD/FMN-containing dehydrogenase
MPLRPALRDFAGELLLPGDPAFDDARRTQNDLIDRRPALIARCAGPGDVVSALRHARENGLPVRVRAGGHGPDTFAVDDDAAVIDLTAMRAVRVDPRRRRVRVQGGATWREVDAATQAHGLAVTGARIPSVGVAGFTLGSGSGWLERRLGLAADSLRSARVVTAHGHVVTAGGEDHPDLFWALRGGGPSFGVVAELELALHPVGTVTAGLLAWPADRAGEVAAAYAELMAGAPDDLGGGLALLTAPPAPFVPAPVRGTPIVAVVVLWTGTGPAPIGALRALGPAIDAVEPMPYRALQGLFESPDRYTARIRGVGGFLDELSPAVAAVLAEQQARKPAALGSILLMPLGGAVARVPDGATPLGQRDAKWAWQAGAAWFDPDEDGPNRTWTDDLRAALTPYARGDAWPNFIPEQDPARLRAAYGPAVWDRLQAIRSFWDPDEVFAGGHAITLPEPPG